MRIAVHHDTLKLTRMTESARHIMVGLTAIIALIALAYLVVVFGVVRSWITDSYALTIDMNNAKGIASGARLRLNGVDIGFVESIELQPPPRLDVMLHCQVRQQYRIPVDARVIAVASILGTTSELNIVTPKRPAEAPEPALVPTDGTGRLVGEAESLGDQFQEVAGRLSAALDEQLRGFGETMQQIKVLSEEYTKVGQRLNAMLEQRDPAAVDAGRAEPNLATVLARTDAGLAKLQRTVDSINEVVGDPKLRENVTATAEEARALMADTRIQLERLTTRYVHTADELSRTLESANALLAAAREGEGTLGRLVADPALYHSLTDAADRLADALTEAKLLMMKWKAEGLPIKF